jgi:hypothetical protein
MSSQHVVMRFRIALQPEGLPLVALVALSFGVAMIAIAAAI